MYFESKSERGANVSADDMVMAWLREFAAEALVPGGVFLSFLPTVMQVHDLTQTLRSQGTFDIIETVEILLRPWSVTSRSIRPAQRMVGHTGFITTARRCSRRSPQNDINVA